MSNNRPMTRIVLFGATGYTGRLTAARLGRDLGPDDELVLAGRSVARLDEIITELSAAGSQTNLSRQIANVDDPNSVGALVTSSDDVLISTVGPFYRWGRPAVEAALNAGCTYIDSTGEPIFLRNLFDVVDGEARLSGARLLPAFGYDYVPGNYAAALAIGDAHQSGAEVHRVDVAYFANREVTPSGGTVASGLTIAAYPGYSRRFGRLRSEPVGRHTREFRLGRRTLAALSLGATEHFGVPAIAPEVQDVTVYMGALGPFTRYISLASRALSVPLSVPGAKSLVSATAGKFVTGSKGGPDDEARAGLRSIALCETFNVNGDLLSRVVVEGPSPYDLTADLLAWAARTTELIQKPGVLSPLQAYSVADLTAGMNELGLVRV